MNHLPGSRVVYVQLSTKGNSYIHWLHYVCQPVYKQQCLCSVMLLTDYIDSVYGSSRGNRARFLKDTSYILPSGAQPLAEGRTENQA